MEINLDNEEMELLKSYNNGEWVSIATPEIISKYQQIARNTLKQKRLINIEISNEDFNIIQEVAVKKGFSYESLVASILHNYAIGKFSHEI